MAKAPYRYSPLAKRYVKRRPAPKEKRWSGLCICPKCRTLLANTSYFLRDREGCKFCPPPE